MQLINHNLNFLRDLFKAEQISFVMESIIEGKNADVYVNDILKPTYILVWDRGHCIYVNAGSDNCEFDRIAKHLREWLFTPEVRQQTRVIKLYLTNEDITEPIIERLQEFKPKINMRSIYKYDLNKQDNEFSLNNSAVIEEINQELINRTELENHELMLDEITGMWGNTKAFIKDGFGFCAIIDNQIVSWCTSEYNSQKYCGIGIETIEKFQGKGIATMETHIFINRCKEKMITPYWDCWKDNIPSSKVAERAGFNKMKDYKIIFLELN